MLSFFSVSLIVKYEKNEQTSNNCNFKKNDIIYTCIFLTCSHFFSSMHEHPRLHITRKYGFDQQSREFEMKFSVNKHRNYKKMLMFLAIIK